MLHNFFLSCLFVCLFVVVVLQLLLFMTKSCISFKQVLFTPLKTINKLSWQFFLGVHKLNSVVRKRTLFINNSMQNFYLFVCREQPLYYDLNSLSHIDHLHCRTSLNCSMFTSLIQPDPLFHARFSLLVHLLKTADSKPT